MSALLSVLLPALLPAAADGVRGIFARLTGGKGALPQNMAEVIQLMNAETERLKTLAQLDQPTGELYKWAATARALQRPALSTLIIVGYMAAVHTGADATVTEQWGQYAQMVTFYLFGDRAYNYTKKGR
jgi:DNA-binding transcriptional regulator YbjK